MHNQTDWAKGIFKWGLGFRPLGLVLTVVGLIPGRPIPTRSARLLAPRFHHCSPRHSGGSRRATLPSAIARLGRRSAMQACPPSLRVTANNSASAARVRS